MLFSNLQDSSLYETLERIDHCRLTAGTRFLSKEEWWYGWKRFRQLPSAGVNHYSLSVIKLSDDAIFPAMKKTQVILSYVLSFAVLITAIAFSLRYLWSVFESTKPNYRTETIYLTQGDSLQNYYSATIPALPVKGMLVLNSISLTPEGYRLASEKGLIVVSAKPFGRSNPFKNRDSLLTFRSIVKAAAQRYHISEDRIMIGDFSKGDTAYVSCKKARNVYMAEPFTPDKTKLPDAESKTLADESGLISWAASVFKEEK